MVIGSAGPARGDTPRTSSLSWTRLPGAESCIAARALAESVEKSLGRSVFVSASQGDVLVEARVQPGADTRGWIAVIAVSSSDGNVLGTRELRSNEPSCHALDDQLALVIALLIDPDAAMREPAAPVAPAAPVTPPPAQVVVRRETVLVPVPVPATDPPDPWRAGADIGPVFALGLLPGFALGLGARITLDPPWRWPVQLDGAVWKEAEASEQGGTAKFRLATAGLSVCPVQVGKVRSRLMACAGAMVGSLRMQSSGFEVNREQEKLVADVSIVARGVQRVAGPLRVCAGAGVLAALERDRFFVRVSDGSTPEVFRMSPVAAWFELGIGVELP